MHFFNSAFRIGNWFGINVRIHVWFVIYLAFRLFGAGAAWQDELRFCILLFGIVLLHEFGHCFGARAVHGRAEEILLWPLGGLAFASAPMRPWPQFVTVASGPAVNVLICLVTGGLLVAARGEIGVLPFPPFAMPSTFVTAEWQVWVREVYFISWALLMFNLLPIYPMDGGQLFQCLLWPFIGLQRSTRIACQVGIAGAVLLGYWGITSGGMILICLAICGAMTCFQRLQMLRAGMVEEDRVHGYDFSRGYTSLDASSRHLDPKVGFWQRVFGWRTRRPNRREPVNPNPGGWQRKLDEEAKLDSELDRILAKVHEHGLHSLTYVERQTLEQVTRRRKEEERDLGRVNR